MTYYYGISSLEHIKLLVGEVVNLLGGNKHTIKQMLGTAAAETHCATYPDDNPDKLGVSLYQFDQIRIDDLHLNSREHFAIVKDLWGYDLATIKLSDLAYDPLLATICCRLAYKRIPEAIPSTLAGQATYWKKYWNTYSENAAGTVGHYLEAVEEVFGSGRS